MASWLPWIAGVAAAIVAFTLFPSIFAYMLGGVVGGQVAGLGSVYRLFGRDPRRPSLLVFLEYLEPPLVAALLAIEPDDAVANVLAGMRPRFGRKVLALMPPLRQESLAYWMAHPQPFPRSEQQALARRLKRALRKAERATGCEAAPVGSGGRGV